jgi:hypothetical protein
MGQLGLLRVSRVQPVISRAIAPPLRAIVEEAADAFKFG